jgi:ATP-dependent DNA helicase
VGEELQTVLKPYLLQRLKKDVLAHLLPSKHEFVVWTRLSSMQRTEYTHFVKNGALVQNILAGFTSSALPSIAWLKKLCGSSMLVDDAVKDDVKSALAQMKTQEVLQHSAKLEVLSAMVPELIQQGHRTLIFSQSTKMLDIIEFVLRSIIGDRIARIDGSTKESNRQKFVDAFNDSDGRFDVMLLSTHAGGVGLTLTGASRSIIFDPDFNPALDAQAVDRCYRLGKW